MEHNWAAAVKIQSFLKSAEGQVLAEIKQNPLKMIHCSKSRALEDMQREHFIFSWSQLSYVFMPLGFKFL